MKPNDWIGSLAGYEDDDSGSACETEAVHASIEAVRESLKAQRRALGDAPDDPAVIAGVEPGEGYYARKHDQGKPRWHLLPKLASAHLAARHDAYTDDGCPADAAQRLVLARGTYDHNMTIDYLTMAADTCVACLGGYVPAMIAVVDVLEFGAIKYQPDSWRNVPDADRRYFDAAMRHLAHAHTHGVSDTDAESGLPTIAHAACNMLFLLDFALLRNVDDDGSGMRRGGFAPWAPARARG